MDHVGIPLSRRAADSGNSNSCIHAGAEAHGHRYHSGKGHRPHLGWITRGRFIGAGPDRRPGCSHPAYNR